ncbi:MAG: YebC/PmpR family DNA-binding transcriptional regulator [Bacteroidales bacterium]|nr:YebC/PmpR family DNA-binding transcriptional regulator [Bacteroidales bacterium]NLK80617.1 YebC/PmpR family DNA-binding transcriptional regulator [Bacteroidales bacterium]
MAGHSKWSKIKRKKGATDTKRSQMFSRISKEITVAVKENGNPDPTMNARLRLAIQNAKGVNMSKEVIERAISKGEKDESTYEFLTFEGYAPGGVAIFIECLSDNNNRTVGAVRSIFTKYNGSLGVNGSLSFIFTRKGMFEIAKKAISISIDELELELIDAGLEEIEQDETSITLVCALDDFGNMQKKLEELSIEATNAELRRVPLSTTQLNIDDALKVIKLIDAFDECEDVSMVYHNLEMTDELAKAIEEL